MRIIATLAPTSTLSLRFGPVRRDGDIFEADDEEARALITRGFAQEMIPHMPPPPELAFTTVAVPAPAPEPLVAPASPAPIKEVPTWPASSIRKR